MLTYTKYWLVFSLALHLGCADVSDSDIFFQEKPLKMMVNTICSTSSNRETADACMGCFWRLSIEVKDPEFSGPYTDCPSLYLKSTKFEDCGNALWEKLEEGNGTSAFCDFDQCIRKGSRMMPIIECKEEAKQKTDDEYEEYILTTNCILCRAYCYDRKFKQQYESSPRYPALAKADSDGLLTTFLSYGINNENVCINNAYHEPQEPQCDCSSIDNETV
ncbi:uncharacterized protein [Anabrus simplex]|uniref:uncharacterized protein n=1 Tax=Anabrus simplex TaxID=316456 RepID=UPI0035A2D46B